MVRQFLARIVTPLVWRWSPRRQAEAMREYSLIEKDSGCQIMDALNLVREPKTRAQLFQQVLEEFHHSDLFEDVCHSLAQSPVGTPVITRDALVGMEPGPNAVLDLIAYVHIGEAAVDQDFRAYAKAPLNPEIAKAFARAGADEHNHVADSRRLLTPFSGGSARRETWAVAKARALRLWRTYLKTMSRIGEVPLSALLTVLYAAAGPLRGACRRRLEMGRDSQLEILREQWKRSLTK
jgi:hypothetical protein